jgi:hypothetical protein
MFCFFNIHQNISGHTSSPTASPNYLGKKLDVLDGLLENDFVNKSLP